MQVTCTEFGQKAVRASESLEVGAVPSRSQHALSVCKTDPERDERWNEGGLPYCEIEKNESKCSMKTRYNCM